MNPVPDTPKFGGMIAGEERFAFLYVAISALAVGCGMTFSWIVGLVWWKTALLLLGLLIGAWGTLFSFLEIRRCGRTAKESKEALEERENPYASREVVVDAPTGEAYPHHEDYVESQGFDQGQLTSRLPDAMPIGKVAGSKK